MTSGEARLELYKHMLECAQFMPLSWLKKNDCDSPFQQAMRMALDALGNQQKEELYGGEGASC